MVAARPPASKAAPQPAGCCTRAGCLCCTRATGRPFARVAAVIRASPTVLFLPLLLFSVCVIGGVIAVRYAANAYAEGERLKATSLVNTATTVRSGCPRAAQDPPAAGPTAAARRDIVAFLAGPQLPYPSRRLPALRGRACADCGPLL
jgi:hypothetical protein